MVMMMMMVIVITYVNIYQILGVPQQQHNFELLSLNS